jgi:predicted dehydrogenase
MSRFKAGVIGCGARGKAHIEAYRLIPQAKVAACCDVIEEKADALARRFGLKAYQDAEAMLREQKLDLLHITTPPDVRLDLLSLASEHGIPACTVEKPLAKGVEDWKALCKLEANSGTKIAVCHQFRWYPDFLKCREAVRSGTLGKVLFLDLSAGMNIAGQGTHILNYSFALNEESPVVAVFGAAAGDEGMKGYHPGPDTTAGYLAYANGVRALWNNGETAPKVGDPDTDWQHVRLAAYAEKGRVLWEEFGKWEIVSPDGREGAAFAGADAWAENNLRAQAGFHQAMLEWMDNDALVPGTHFAQSLHEWKVVLALYASALERRPITLSEFDPPTDLLGRLKTALAEQGDPSPVA